MTHVSIFNYNSDDADFPAFPLDDHTVLVQALDGRLQRVVNIGIQHFGLQGLQVGHYATDVTVKLVVAKGL